MIYTIKENKIDSVDKLNTKVQNINYIQIHQKLSKGKNSIRTRNNSN